MSALEQIRALYEYNAWANGHVDLGLIPCQVQNGELVNLLGPNAGTIVFP